MKPRRDVQEKLPRIKEKRNQHGMCKGNSPQKNKGSMGCVRETPNMKMKPAGDALNKLPK